LTSQEYPRPLTSILHPEFTVTFVAIVRCIGSPGEWFTTPPFTNTRLLNECAPSIVTVVLLTVMSYPS
jgi:hypothetical protein